jgi:DNA polymerase III sliding clamp (beta) subunit (PCNA family)
MLAGSSYALLRQEGDRVLLSGGTPDATIEFELDVEGRLAAPVRLHLDEVYKIASKAKKRELTIEPGEGEDEHIKVAITIDGKATFNLAYEPAEDHWTPGTIEMPIDNTELPAEAVELIDRCIPFASKDTARGNLCGVHMESNRRYDNHERIRFTATDGHRLMSLALNDEDVAARLQEVMEGPTQGGYNPSVIIPREDAEALVAIFDDAPITVGFSRADDLGVKIVFRQGGVSFSTHYINGSYPDWRQLGHGASHSLKSFFSRDEMESQLDLARLCIPPKHPDEPMVLSVDPEHIVVETGDEDRGFKGRVMLELEGNTTDRMKVGLNLGYFADALTALGADEVEMTWGEDALSAMLLEDANQPHSVVLLMPRRLKV